MISASVTVKMSPGIYSVICDAVEAEQKRAAAVAIDRHTDIKIRADERARAERLSAALRELRR